jgi:hypothetical protein
VGLFQAEASCRSQTHTFWTAAARLRGQTQSFQTTVQQPPIDVNVVRNQFLKDSPKIAQITPQVEGFKQTDASHNSKAFRLRYLASPVIVEQNGIRTELLRQQDCAHLARTQPIFPLRRIQTCWILHGVHFDPFRLRHLGRSRKASACDDNFVVNFGGNINMWEKSMEKVKTAKFGENNKRE